jgi:hypothetical protein
VPTKKAVHVVGRKEERTVKKPSANNQARVIPAGLTFSEEEELYFQDTGSHPVTINVEHFEKDVICSKCGLWKSEHLWDVCKEPNWL